MLFFGGLDGSKGFTSNISGSKVPMLGSLMLAVAKTRTSVYQCYNRARTQLAPRIEIMRIKFILHEVFGHLLGVREY